MSGSDGEGVGTQPPGASGWSLKPYLPALLMAAVYLFALCVFISSLDVDFNIADEGLAAMGAWRIAEGQVCNADFLEIIPPFSFMPTALAFKVLGPTIFAERLTTLLLGMLLILSVDCLLRLAGASAPSRAVAGLFLVPCGVLYWFMPSHHWVVAVVQIFALSALILAARSGANGRWALLSGVLCGLGCFTLQDQGAYLVAGLAVLFFPWLAGRGARWRPFLWWSAGGAAVAFLFALYLFPHASLADLWDQWVAWPLSHYKVVEGNRGGLFKGWDTVLASYTSTAFKVRPLTTAAAMALNGLLSLLPLAGAASLLAAWRVRWVPRPTLSLLLCGYIAFLLACAHRWTLMNLAWAGPMFIVPAVLALDRLSRGPALWRRIGATSVLVVMALAGTVYGVSFIHQSMGYGGAVVTVRTKAGTVRSRNLADGMVLKTTVSGIETFVPPDAPLLCAGFIPFVNFATQRRNPARFGYLAAAVFNDPQQEAEVARTLDQLDRVFVLQASSSGIEGTPFEKYLQEKFRPVWKGPIGVLWRKEPLRETVQE